MRAKAVFRAPFIDSWADMQALPVVEVVLLEVVLLFEHTRAIRGERNDDYLLL